MRDLLMWLLVVDTLVPVMMVAYGGGIRPLVPMRIPPQPAYSDHHRSR